MSNPQHPPPKLLIVEDDENLRTQLKWALAQDYAVLLAGDQRSALQVLDREQPAVVTLDLGLPPHPHSVEEGMQTLARIIEQDALIKVIVITGQTERVHALQAVSQGAYDYLCKPIDLEELRVILRRASHVVELERENRALQQQLSGERDKDAFEGMIGVSPRLQEVFAIIRRVAPTDVSVLVEGESGTGKELVARALHRLSERAGGPFVTINCAAIPETLLESELFGYEKGAFTGANAQKKGRIEAAQGGTLFLDEVGELSFFLQAKLLRFLQEHQIERLGDRKAIPLDIRVIAATNKDLKQAIVEGRFREDLYYRLAVIVLSLPPLREREGDIELLAKELLQRYAVQNKKKLTGFTPQALRALKTHHWPGNVRELENRIRRAVLMVEKAKVTATHLELATTYDKYEGKGLREAREAVEREMVQRALARSQGNLTQAAADLGISRPTLYELMEKLGIDRSRV
jgi:two-component system NtrC family response regulator